MIHAIADDFTQMGFADNCFVVDLQKDVIYMEASLGCGRAGRHIRYGNSVEIRDSHLGKDDAINNDPKEQIHHSSGEKHGKAHPGAGICKPSTHFGVIFAFEAIEAPNGQPIEGEFSFFPTKKGNHFRWQANAEFFNFYLEKLSNNKMPNFMD